MQLAMVSDLVESGVDWAKVCSQVIRHGVVGSFCHIMGQLDWPHVPVATKDRLKTERRLQVVRALAQEAELCRVASLFAASGVTLIPLKGVALSQELYGDPFMRSSGDIDILVRVEDVPRAEELLVGLCYRNAIGFHSFSRRQQLHIIRSEHHHEYINDESGIHIELHWRSYLWNEAQVSALWDGSLPSKWAANGNQLSKVDNILFLADHGARHGWQRLKWLSDLAMLMENCSVDDWDAIYGRADFFELHRPLLETALLLNWCYGIEPSSRVCMQIASDKTVRRLANDSLKQLIASDNESFKRSKYFYGIREVIRLKQLKPTTPFLSILRSFLIIHADFLEFPLPDHLFWLYLPLRPFFWFKRHFLH